MSIPLALGYVSKFSMLTWKLAVCLCLLKPATFDNVEESSSAHYIINFSYN